MADEPDIRTEENAYELAQIIQDATEDFISEKKR